MKTMFKIAVVAAAVTAAFRADAYTTTITYGATSLEPGVVTLDFDAATPAPFAYSGGALYTTSIGGITAVPPGSTGNHWSVGPSTAGLVTIGGGGASYYGFLWGSPDTYNTVKFYSGATLLGSFTGAAVYPPANGDQSIGRYFNFFADPGAPVTQVQFLSSNYALETDNHSVVAVPEPETYAMFLAGLGMMGAVARRRTAARA